MILVTTGANGAPCDRLLAVVERFDTDEEIFVQHGPSQLRPARATCVDFVPFERLAELVSQARVVVAHAGVGSILLCASKGRVPIVVPRLARYAEAVDDHQLFLARRLHRGGTVVCAEDPADVPGLLAACCGKPSVNRIPAVPSLAADVGRYIDSVLR